MLKKTLLIALLAVFATPAFAQNAATMSSSDEDFLADLPADQFPGNNNTNPGMQDIDGDGIADNVANMIPTGQPGTQPEDQKKVQYVYKPSSDTELKRTIQDPRIDDGYVQGLMQQRGPTQ